MICGRSEEKLKAASLDINSENLHLKVFDIADVDAHQKLFLEAEKIL